MDGGRDHLSVLAYAQRVQKEQRSINISASMRGVKPPFVVEEGVPARPAQRFAPASSITVYDTVYSSSPRGSLIKAVPPLSPTSPTSPRPVPTGRPHMQHHYGYGWGDGIKTPGIRSFDATASPRLDGTDRAWELYSDANQHATGLAPTIRAVDTDTKASFYASNPMTASRKPYPHPEVKPHTAHFLSWPGQCLYVPRTKHFFKADVSSHREKRGEKPINAQVLISSGSRPPFPYFASTAKPLPPRAFRVGMATQ